jgi:hypothetical protein
MVTKTDSPTLGDVVKWEANPSHGREQIVLASGKAYKLGTVLGRLRVGGAVTVAAGAADAGNTGNGTLTLAGTPYSAAVREGKYRVVFVSATRANVFDPQGVQVGTATVGSAFSGPIAFTLAAGGTAFAAGDAWTVAVSIAANTGECDEWDPASGTGLEEVYGVLLWDVDASTGAVQSVALRRMAAVSRDALVFKAGTTAAQKLDAFDQLDRLTIAVRETV